MPLVNGLDGRGCRNGLEMTPADDTFLLGMRYIEDAVMARRSAAHFSDESFRSRREAEAESDSRTGYALATLGIAVPSGQP